jgi:hypothetical protein
MNDRRWWRFWSLQELARHKKTANFKIAIFSRK